MAQAEQDGRSPSSEGLCLIKQLLRHIAATLPALCAPGRWQRGSLDERSRVIYRHFLRTCVHFNTDLSLVGGLNDDTLLSLFGAPDEEPTFMTFHGKGADLAKLSAILHIDLVIYMRGPKSHSYKWHDSRVQSQLVDEGSSGRRCYFFVAERRKDAGFLLSPVPESRASKEYSPGESEARFISGKSLLVGDCYLKALALLLGIQEPPTDWPVCATLASLCRAIGPSLPHGIKAALVGRRLLLAVHQSTGCRFRHARKKGGQSGKMGIFEPSNQVYRIIAWYAGPGENLGNAVICATLGGRLYVPHEPYAAQVAAGLKYPTSNSLTTPKVEALGRGRGSKAEAASAPEATEDAALPESACKCRLCHDGLKYYNNFVPKSKRRGARRRVPAQRPFRCDLDSVEYFRAFALDTPENLERLRRAWNLCLASMDVESMTENLPSHASDEVGGIENLTHFRYDSSPRMKQTVVVFAHADFMDRDGLAETEDSVPVFFRVTETKSLARLSVEYLQYIRARRDAAARLKEELLKPAFSVLSRLREAHEEYCRRRAPHGESEAARKARTQSSYGATIAGQFEAHLQRVVRSYYVFAYNGRGYDFILMAPPFISAAARLTPPARVQIMREGNQIRTIRIEKGLVFRDLCCLSGHSVSLAQLVRSSGIQQEKSIFPYKQLSSLESLKDPELSEDPAMWASELSARGPSAEEIKEARALFKERGMTSLSCWLDRYLALDVTCLLLVARKLLDRFHSLLGCHPIDVGRLTIASYSSYVSQLFLFKHRRPAMYSPMTTSLYSSLRDTTKGGLVQVSRHHCDAEDKDPSARINAHIMESLRKGSKQESRASSGEGHFAEGEALKRSRKVIQEILERFGEEMLPSTAATFTPGQPSLSSSRPLEAAHAAIRRASGIFKPPPEDPPHRGPLGRPVDFLASGRGSWLLSQREREEGAQQGRFTLYLDEHGEDLNPSRAPCQNRLTCLSSRTLLYRGYNQCCCCCAPPSSAHFSLASV